MWEARGLAGRVQGEVAGLGVVGASQVPDGGLTGWDRRARLTSICLSEEGLRLGVQGQVTVVTWNHKWGTLEAEASGNPLAPHCTPRLPPDLA